jgi:hypothetical protein
MTCPLESSYSHKNVQFGRDSVVIEAFANSKLTIDDGHDLFATAYTQGVGWSRTKLNRLIQGVTSP